MISGLVVLVVSTVGDGVESGHHADAANLVFGVHVVTLVTEGCEIHTSRAAHTVDKGIDLLTALVGIVDGLLVVVLSPS